MDIKTTKVEHTRKKHKRAVRGDADVDIILLVNSPYYFLGCVFIAVENSESYRLVVLHNNRVLTDIRYKTVRGAKIAFSKFYREKAWREDIKADWSITYPPDADWLEERLRHDKTN